MKKYIVIGCMGLAIIFLSLYAAMPQQQKPQLGKHALEKIIKSDSQLDPNIDKTVHQMIVNAQDIYSSREFMEFITATDDDGWNIFMHYAANGQIAQLSWLLDIIKKIYGKSQKDVFNILFNKDKYGRSLLYIAVMREQVGSVDTILTKIQEMLTNKDLLFAFIESPDDLTGWTPLMFAAYLNNYAIMQLILKAEVKIFGQAPPRIQINLRKAYALSSAKGQALIQQYQNFPVTKTLKAGKSGVAV